MQDLAHQPTLTALVLGSAAVGALVSSVITLVGQHIERRARRRELLLTESVKLALAHKESLIEIAKLGRMEVYIPEHVRLVQTYFVGMSQMILDGTLPKGMFSTDSEEDRDNFQAKGKWRS